MCRCGSSELTSQFSRAKALLFPAVDPARLTRGVFRFQQGCSLADQYRISIVPVAVKRDRINVSRTPGNGVLPEPPRCFTAWEALCICIGRTSHVLVQAFSRRSKQSGPSKSGHLRHFCRWRSCLRRQHDQSEVEAVRRTPDQFFAIFCLLRHPLGAVSRRWDCLSAQ